MARIGITAMPERGVDISLIPISGGRCIVRLFKDQQSTEVDGMTQLTADAVELPMVYYDGLQVEVESNFDNYFELGAQKELAGIKTKKVDEIKQLLMKANLDYLNGVITEEEFNSKSNELKTEYNLL